MTNKEIDKLLTSFKIIVDTREKKNQHILDWLEKNDIPFVLEKLDVGDYSYLIEGHPELSKLVCVERKNSLDEIIGNFTKGRQRFEREFQRGMDANIKMDVVIEGLSFTKLFNGSYRSQVHPNFVFASFVGLNNNFGVNVWGCKPSESGGVIYNIILWNLRRKLKEIDL